MGLYIRQDEQRSKLQERIAADLREKALETAKRESEPVDGVDDSAYMEGSKDSSGLLGIWLVLLVIGVGVVVFLIVRSTSA